MKPRENGISEHFLPDELERVAISGVRAHMIIQCIIALRFSLPSAEVIRIDDTGETHRFRDYNI